MKSGFDLLVFDWDGTLADSVDQIVASMIHALEAAALAPRSAGQIRAIIGLGMNEALDALYPRLSATDRERVAAVYREHYRSAQAVRLFPGARDALEALRDAGHLLAVATGKGRHGLDAAMHAAGVGGLFHATRTADQTASKPAPRMLLELMAQFDVAPRRTLMIGDSEHDLRMATNAGVPALAVLSGTQDPRALLEFAPLACIESVAALPAWLMQARHIATNPPPAAALNP